MIARVLNCAVIAVFSVSSTFPQLTSAISLTSNQGSLQPRPDRDLNKSELARLNVLLGGMEAVPEETRRQNQAHIESIVNTIPDDAPMPTGQSVTTSTGSTVITGGFLQPIAELDPETRTVPVTSNTGTAKPGTAAIEELVRIGQEQKRDMELVGIKWVINLDDQYIKKLLEIELIRLWN